MTDRPVLLQWGDFFLTTAKFTDESVELHTLGNDQDARIDLGVEALSRVVAAARSRGWKL